MRSLRRKGAHKRGYENERVGGHLVRLAEPSRDYLTKHSVAQAQRGQTWLPSGLGSAYALRRTLLQIILFRGFSHRLCGERESY